MLRRLRIRNIAIIEDLTIDFGDGFNVITGETGTGKSILMRSLGLLCGHRAATDVIRGQVDSASVEGVFEVELEGETRAALGIDEGDGNEVVVRRIISRTGKGKIFVNGNAATASMLRELSTGLVHIYGQHEQSLLLRPGNHLDYVDAFGGKPQLRRDMAAAYAGLRDAQRQLDDCDDHARAAAERRELLDFQRSELAAAELVAGEEADLCSERDRLRHADRIAEVCTSGERELYAADDAMVARLARLAGATAELADVLPDLASPAELIEQARLHLEEAALQLREVATGASAEPARLDEVENRLALLRRLGKKYGVPIGELPAVFARLEDELGSLAARTLDRERAGEVLAECLAKAAGCATALTRHRKRTAKRLTAAMREELAQLGMDGGAFEVVQETSAMRSIDDFTASGADRIELFLSANRGEAAQPLARVASGGELSRILLALKALTADTSETPILIFDEVDAGIGGTVADAVARRLRRLAAARQVLCITHLAQIAASAEHHFAVEKHARKGRTVSVALPLHGEERVNELSRMLGAPASDEAIRYARELIEQGRATP